MWRILLYRAARMDWQGVFTLVIVLLTLVAMMRERDLVAAFFLDHFEASRAGASIRKSAGRNRTTPRKVHCQRNP